MLAKGDDIQERLVVLAARVVTFCNGLPRSTAGSHLANQLMRSGTSPAPNYAEARGAESDRDFVHKLRVVVKERTKLRYGSRSLSELNLPPQNQFSQCGMSVRRFPGSLRQVSGRCISVV